MQDGLPQNVAGCGMQTNPFGGPQLITTPLRMDGRDVQDFRGVQVSNTGDGFLIEQGDFDFSPRAA